MPVSAARVVDFSADALNRQIAAKAADNTAAQPSAAGMVESQHSHNASNNTVFIKINKFD